MASLTKAQRDQIRSLRDAADGGLPARLGRFIHIVCDSVEANPMNLPGRLIQEHLDTLTDLIDTRVHHPGRNG